VAKKSKRTFKTLKEEERQLRKDVILDAAERVFTSIPFNKVTIRKIAEEAAISPASIYTYFYDQEELFVEICRRRGKDTPEMSKKIKNEYGTDAIRQAAFAYIEYFAKPFTCFRMITQFMLYPELRPESAKKLSALQSDVLDNLEAALKKSKIRGDTKNLAYLFLAGLNGILVNSPMYPGRSEEDIIQYMKDLASKLCDMFYAGGGGGEKLPAKSVKK
jgi:AcrR family transcriptional regulator